MNLRTIDMPNCMINLAISAEDLEVMQACIEFCQQHINHSHKKDAEKFYMTTDELYDFSKEWSFKIRRILEGQKKMLF